MSRNHKLLLQRLSLNKPAREQRSQMLRHPPLQAVHQALHRQNVSIQQRDRLQQEVVEESRQLHQSQSSPADDRKLQGKNKSSWRKRRERPRQQRSQKKRNKRLAMTRSLGMAEAGFEVVGEELEAAEEEVDTWEIREERSLLRVGRSAPVAKSTAMGHRGNQAGAQEVAVDLALLELESSHDPEAAAGKLAAGHMAEEIDPMAVRARSRWNQSWAIPPWEACQSTQ